MKKKLTHEDIEALKEYRAKMEALEKEEPEPITAEEWDEAMQAITKNGGIVPQKYADRIGAAEDTVYSTIIDGEFTAIPEGMKVKTYFDIRANDYTQRHARLTTQYHDTIKKALQTYREDAATQEKAAGIVEIILELLNDPNIRKELEKETQAETRLAPLGSLPNGDSLNWLLRVTTSSKGGRMVQQNPNNRHEQITIQEKADTLKFTKENTQSGSTVIVEISQAKKYLESKTNKIFSKMLLFALQKMTAQNFPLEVGFSLQELVDLGMYSTTSNAGRAVKDFFEQQKQTTLCGSVKKGKKTIREEGGVLFYHYRLENGYVKLSVNENFNMEFIANYFTVFPRFAYSLSNNAFSLVRYIFFLARQNTQAIKNKGTFTISLDSVRQNLGLPAIDEVKNRKYRQFIINPIEQAIEEIETALQTVPEAQEYGFTITPHGTDTSNINKWLEGYLEIGLKGDFADTFLRIAMNTEKDRAQWEKAKAAELARIAAREEAKAAKAK